MVVAGGVEGEVAEEFTGGGVDDADLEVAADPSVRYDARHLSAIT